MEDKLQVHKTNHPNVKNSIVANTLWMDTAFDFGLSLAPAPPIINNQYMISVQPFVVIKLKPKDIVVGELQTHISFNFKSVVDEESAIKYFYQFILDSIKEFNMEMWKNGIPKQVYFNGSIEFKDLYPKIKAAYFSNSIN